MLYRCRRAGLGDLSGQIISVSKYVFSLKTYRQDVVTAGTEAVGKTIAGGCDEICC